ncbi:MAG: hypothetical protein GXO62_02745 [Epsilonproteobacteria bacterium]|nr:hypothetical protein [Campylobacterota bacterium]
MKKYILGLMSAAMLYAGNFVNFEITNSTLGANLQVGLNQYSGVYARGGYLYNDNDNRDDFYYAGIKAEGQLVGVSCANVTFSLITDYVHTTDNSAVAIGFGAFSFIRGFAMPLFARAEYEYAPKILSFDDADRFSRVRAEVGLRPIENGEFYVGYRNISFNKNYNSAVYFGLGYNF